MPRKIVVSSNCQAASLAAALQVIFQDDQVSPVYLPADFKATSSPEVANLVEKLLDCDIWVTIGHEEILDELKIRERNPDIATLRIPTIAFSAFHPDLAYVKVLATGHYVVPHYNSAIGVWGYNNGLTVEKTANLFTGGNFRKLGYLDVWDNSVKYLSELFSKTDIKLADFFPAVKRHGIFMHSVNHPWSFALVHLAKLIAVKIGASTSVIDAPIVMPDVLDEAIWPVYPEIGDALGIPGIYLWKMNGRYYNSLERYLDFAFKNYESKNLNRGDIQVTNPNLKIYDEVLGASK